MRSMKRISFAIVAILSLTWLAQFAYTQNQAQAPASEARDYLNKALRSGKAGVRPAILQFSIKLPIRLSILRVYLVPGLQHVALVILQQVRIG